MEGHPKRPTTRRDIVVAVGMLAYLAVAIALAVVVELGGKRPAHWAIVGLYAWAIGALVLAVNFRRLVGLPK
jgi:Kef-type K+ transport system membrane component KefB